MRERSDRLWHPEKRTIPSPSAGPVNPNAVIENARRDGGAAHHRNAGKELYALCDERDPLPGPFPRLTVSSLRTASCSIPCTRWDCSPRPGPSPPMWWVRPCGSTPMGDAAIYETLVRLSRGYEALLYPYVDSKGNFGQGLFPGYGLAASRIPRISSRRSVRSCSRILTRTPWTLWTTMTPP